MALIISRKLRLDGKRQQHVSAFIMSSNYYIHRKDAKYAEMNCFAVK